MPIKIKGKIQVSNGVRIVINSDICRYYQSLIRREMPWIKTQLPTHGGHVTIYNPKLHGKADLKLASYLRNKEVELTIFPERLNQSKVNFWIPATAAIYDEVKRLLRFKETDRWLGLHLTVCNTKFNG
jgi:hypothetical protein